MQAQIALKVLHHLHLLCRPRAIKSAFKWDIVGSLSLRTYLKTNQLLSINSALRKFSYGSLLQYCIDMFLLIAKGKNEKSLVLTRYPMETCSRPSLTKICARHMKEG